MQQSRQLDPNLLVKQQTPPSQQQSLHQPAMKSFLENVMPHTTPELQKGPSPVNAFSSFPIGGSPWPKRELMRGYRRRAWSLLRSSSAPWENQPGLQRAACTPPEKTTLHLQSVRIKKILLFETQVS